MGSLGATITIIVIVLVALFGLGALLSLLPWRLQRVPASQPFVKRFRASRKVLLSVGAVLVAGSATLSVLSPSYFAHGPQLSVDNRSIQTYDRAHRVTIRFSNPRGTRQNRLLVSCTESIEVTGHLSEGDSFAVGNAVDGNQSPTFVSEEAATPIGKDTWRVPMVFGKNSDANGLFTVYLVVMPTRMMTFLLDMAEAYTGKPFGQSWKALGVPPPARIQDKEFAQRTPSKTGCPKAGA